MGNFFRWLFLLMLRGIIAFSLCAAYVVLGLGSSGNGGQLPRNESLMLLFGSVIISYIIVDKIFRLK